MTKDQLDLVLESARSWPDEDREELIAAAREIETRRVEIAVLSDDERRAIAEALAGPLASEDEVAAIWKKFGLR
ncbi:MAG TPA: hypothetical protein VMH86_12180 [Rhizomicrobium sp.]|nr:hypothetical protein [Rhizomicrobium sp.]